MYVCTWTKWKVSIWHEPEVITRVPIYSFDESHDEPQPEGLNVGLEENWAKEKREGVA